MKKYDAFRTRRVVDFSTVKEIGQLFLKHINFQKQRDTHITQINEINFHSHCYSIKILLVVGYKHLDYTRSFISFSRNANTVM